MTMKSERSNTRQGVGSAAKWGALAMASAAALFLAAGCGEQEDRAASTGGTSTEAMAAEQRTPAGAAVPAAATPSLAETAATPAAAQEEPRDAISIDSLPPDVAAYVVSKDVEPGEIIEVAAQGSPDVSEVNLADGIGRVQPMTYDSTAGLWRTYYRVPIQAQAERLGLSVTAKNSLHRWRRVWVFLTVRTEGAVADSVSGR
jgi:hypothetical protein